jgi:hypothetical protein
MENSESVQQQSSQAKASIPESGKKIAGRTGSKNPLIHLLVHYPWLLPTGLSVAFLGSSAVALYSLSHVGRIEQQEPEIAEAEVVQPIKTPSENTNPMPLWMVLAIILSCASGSLILFLLLNRPAQRQKVKNHINRYQARVAQRRPSVDPRPKNMPVFVPSQARTPIVAIPIKTQPVVTVLPPQQNPSRSQGKESLANTLDIRKHTPLSSILRKD